MPKTASKLQGLRLAALYSVGCPDLKEKERGITAFIKTTCPSREMVSGLREALRRTEAFFFYMLIGLRSGVSDYFREDIVSAHWLPENIPLPITEQDVRLLLAGKDNMPSGYPKKAGILKKIAQLVGLPSHHNFAVFQPIRMVRRGTVLPAPFLKRLNDCLVKPVRVVRVLNPTPEIEVEILNLEYDGDQLVLKIVVERTEQGFVRDVKPGDFLTTHFGKARQKITLKQAAVLGEITGNAFAYLITGRA